MYKVMLRDNLSERAREILEQAGNIQVVVDNEKSSNNPDVLAEIIQDFDGLLVRSNTKINRHVIEKGTLLKIIGRAGIGVDNIDVGAATKKGIVVMNAPGGNTVTTAEHAISMMLSLARNIPQATESIRKGNWEKKKFMGVEIADKILGIVGLGNIGRVVAARAIGLKMKVIASDPYVTKDAADSLGVSLVPLDVLLETSDFISLHIPNLPETKNMIRKETLEKMKQGVRIINCARGDIVNINDLYGSLESGHVAGVALDVYSPEPPDFSLPIFQHPNAIFTPHLGASTEEAQEKVSEMVAKQMVEYFNAGVVTNAINFPSIPMEIIGRLRPYLTLSERMGSLLGQLVRKPNNITIHYSGNVSKFDPRVLTHAVLKGYLSAFSDTPLTYVNAYSVTKDKGIDVEEIITQQMEDFYNLIRVKLEGCEDGINEVWGTVFEKQYQRIVRLGEIHMDAIPEGSMLVIQNEDMPGVIGNVGTLLARHGINIARFHLGRNGGKAICMINIDTPAESKVVEEILLLPHILEVHKIQFE